MDSQEFMQSTLDGLTAHIALLDDAGTILLVNKAWRDFAQQNGADADAVCEGTNYLSVCIDPEASDPQAKDFAEGLQQVLDGKQEIFSMEYPCETEEKNYWFNVCVSHLHQGGSRRAVVFHTDITAAKKAEIALIENMKELRRFNKAAVGREMRMVELKKEINHLCRKLGREASYPLYSDDGGAS